MLIRQNKKGQVATIDLFLAIMIFTLIITTVLFTWNSYNAKIDKQIEYNSNLIKAYHISDLLVKYSGKPSSWHQSTIEDNEILIIGLAKEDRVIDPDKLTRFLSFEYDLAREKLNINSYEFYFKISEINGDDLNPTIEYGNMTDSESAVVIRRYVIYEERETILEFWLKK